MNNIVLSKVYTALPFCEKEILRYAGGSCGDEKINEILNECINEIKDRIWNKVCYRELEFNTDGAVCDFGLFSVVSEKLALSLKGAKNVILFAATIGIETDRLIAKYSKLSPLKSLLFQAIGAQQIEALCDAFCNDMGKEYNSDSTPRFSPGYGDLSLETQKTVFRFLEPEKHIGLTLNDSSVMSPSKSVTGFIMVKK